MSRIIVVVNLPQPINEVAELMKLTARMNAKAVIKNAAGMEIVGYREDTIIEIGVKP